MKVYVHENENNKERDFYKERIILELLEIQDMYKLNQIRKFIENIK